MADGPPSEIKALIDATSTLSIARRSSFSSASSPTTPSSSTASRLIAG